MHHKCLHGFLERLDGLALPAKRSAIDGEEGETDFADLDWGSMGEFETGEW